MARQVKKLISEVTMASCEEAFAAYNTTVSNLQVIEGKMNADITAIKEKYEAKINQLQEERDEHFEMMQAFAENSPELFEKKKSIEFTHGVLGFRTGTPKLSCLKGFKWPAVLTLVKDRLPAYVRIKEDLDKERLLADRTSIDLKSIGVSVEQDETFFVQPKLEQFATT